MNIAAFSHKNIPRSSRIYFENITRELKQLGHTVIPFTGKKLPVPVDVCWDPSTGRNGPAVLLKNVSCPVVVTFHGVANLALPISECFGPGIHNRLLGYASRRISLYSWRGRIYDSVIAVSEYAKNEAERCLGIPGHRITPVYHGVNHTIFTPADRQNTTEPYLLHVSSNQPKKNLERIIEAYRRIPTRPKPRFIILSPGYARSHDDAGVEIRIDPIDNERTAELYRNALGFIFPSLHETFGMPILEAMACGCPVITSNDTGCAEISGTAALLVDPRSIGDITEAMIRVLTDEQLRQTLRDMGIEHARRFMWSASAAKHLTVFHEAIHKHRSGTLHGDEK